MARWLKQITSFSACQRSTWPGAACCSGAASASAASAAPAKAAAPAAAAKAAAPAAAAKPAAAKKPAADSDDDGFAMSSDDEDDAAIQAIADRHNKARQEKAAASGKAAKIDKSMLTIFVKPLESETDMNQLAKRIIAEVKLDSLQWGDYKSVEHTNAAAPRPLRSCLFVLFACCDRALTRVCALLVICFVQAGARRVRYPQGQDGVHVRGSQVLSR